MEPTTLLQVQTRSGGLKPWVPPWYAQDGELSDDGSQVSMPGPEVSLDDAIRRFGGTTGSSTALDGVTGASSAVDDIAVVYVSGRTEFDYALRKAVLMYVAMGDIYKTPGKTTSNFVDALSYAIKRFPGARWYYLAADDSFVHLRRLRSLAASLNPADFVYAGHRACEDEKCPKVVVKCRRQRMVSGRGMPGWASGGPGVLISRALAGAMAKQNCAPYYGARPAPVCCGDMALACCAFDAWAELQILSMPQFIPGDASRLLAPGGRAVAVYRITNETLLSLGAYNSQPAS